MLFRKNMSVDFVGFVWWYARKLKLVTDHVPWLSRVERGALMLPWFFCAVLEVHWFWSYISFPNCWWFPWWLCSSGSSLVLILNQLPNFLWFPWYLCISGSSWFWSLISFLIVDGYAFWQPKCEAISCYVIQNIFLVAYQRYWMIFFLSTQVTVTKDSK